MTLSARATTLLARIRDGEFYPAHAPNTPKAMIELIEAGLVVTMGRVEKIISCYVPVGSASFRLERIGPGADLLPGLWRPIAEAPRDGTEVDLWMSDQRWTGFRWLRGGWSRQEGYPVVERRLMKEPTHYMLAPGAPE